MPAQLMELMRHESIDTTLSYYVGRNAERTAAILWHEHEKAAEPEQKAIGKSRGRNGARRARKEAKKALRLTVRLTVDPFRG